MAPGGREPDRLEILIDGGMLHDRYGLPVSCQSPAALDAYVDGVDRLLSANAGADECFARAVERDPAFALAHVGLARARQLQGRIAEARSAASLARSLGATGTSRERGHVDALALAVDGAAAPALAALRVHLAGFPRDAMVLAPATGVYGLIGFSGRRDREHALLALLDGVAAAYGDDWWFLGAHGFARTEALGWAAGAPLIERSLAIDPRNAHAAHAWAHVCYERGSDDDGAAFVSAWLPAYPRAAQLHCHLSWHLALFCLARGQASRAWDLYMDAIRPGAALSSGLPLIADAASLVWRAELSGEGARPERWKEVAGYAARAFPAPGNAFADAHCGVAFAAAGDADALERWLAAIDAADREGRSAAGPVLRRTIDGMAAFARGDYDGAAERLGASPDDFVRIGGSRAQRDVFEHTLLAACWRSGRVAEAEALLARRLDRSPTIAVRRPG